MKLIDINDRLSNPAAKAAWRLVGGRVESILGLREVEQIYNSLDADNAVDFFAAGLKALDVSWSVPQAALDALPSGGPLLIAANHPFGAVEGLVLGELIGRVRPDFKLLGNYLLHSFPELKETVIPVDPFGAPEAVRSNVRGMAEAARWLRGGHALGVFPSGEVAHLDFKRGKITDPVWSAHIAALVRRARATVVPVFFPGHNSVTFNLMGLLHPRMRTMLLLRELLATRGKLLEPVIGKPIQFGKLENIIDDRELTEYIRGCTYLLGTSRRKPVHRFQALAQKVQKPKPVPPVADAVPGERIEHELKALPESRMLAGEKGFEIWLAKADEVPATIRELGRLREITFRAVGEGTGRELDLDEFDNYYLHLLLWDSRERCLAGAYRLGPVDGIVERMGVAGLYTNTLFRYRAELLEKLHDSVELGRSFIRQEYQRNPSCLMLLWKGIGSYLAANPRYRCVFGPVSISGEYHQLSRQLIVSHLREKCLEPGLTRLVRPRKPYRMFPFGPREYGRIASRLTDIEEVGLMVSAIESDGKGVPVLLRHYLRLNATILSFNVDKEFSGVLDGLIFVDLTRTDRKYLTRFMGREGMESFLAAHGVPVEQPEAIPELAGAVS
jgi:putative hemolysin